MNGTAIIGRMRMSRSGHIQRQESRTVERTTWDDCTDDTREPLLGRKISFVGVAAMLDYTDFPLSSD
jgi:hypothetical protein